MRWVMKPFNCASLLVILALLLGAAGCGAQPAPVQPTAGGGPQLNAPPGETALDPHQKPGQGVVADDEGENEEILIPTNPNAHPERVVPGKESAFSEAQPGGLGPQAAGTFTVYRNSSLLAADFPNTWHVAEPS